MKKQPKQGETRQSGRPIPDNKTRDAVLARISARNDVRPHRDQRQLHGTKYISAFSSQRGTAFAVDKMSASKQPIWYLDGTWPRSVLDDAGIAYEVYPQERGRNHNLHKIPGFKDGALIRAYPGTVDEALRIVDSLSFGSD